MKNKIKLIATAIALLAFSQVTHAVSINWIGGGTTDDWNDTANWSTDYVPGATTVDNAIFNTSGDDNTPTADFVFVTAGTDVTVRNGALITVGANGDANGGVDISGFDFWRLGANAGNGGGAVTMTGGSLSGATFQVASSATATTRSTFTVSGGDLTTTSGFSIGALGDFDLTGDDASFDVATFAANSGSIFNATFDASGISTVAAVGNVTVGATAVLNLDFTAFSGTGVFDLATGTVASSYDLANVTGLGALTGGRVATLGSDAGSIFVTIAVPEPGTYALLAGLTGLACVMVRRRRA